MPRRLEMINEAIARQERAMEECPRCHREAVLVFDYGRFQRICGGCIAGFSPARSLGVKAEEKEVH